MFTYERVDFQLVTDQMKFVAIFLTAVELTELFIYASINVFVLSHNRTMLKSTVITRETFRNRQRCHIYSLASQMSHFFVDIVFTFTWNLAILSSTVTINIFEIAGILKIVSFGVLSVVQILSSSDFRSKFLSIIRKFRS